MSTTPYVFMTGTKSAHQNASFNGIRKYDCRFKIKLPSYECSDPPVKDDMSHESVIYIIGIRGLEKRFYVETGAKYHHCAMLDAANLGYYSVIHVEIFGHVYRYTIMFTSSHP